MEKISKKGLVVENNEGNLKIMVQRDGGCGSCSTCGGCDIKPSFVNVKSSGDYKVGDSVYIDSDYQNVSRLSNKIFGLPVLFIILAALLSNQLAASFNWDQEGAIFFAVVIAILLSLSILKRMDKKYEGKSILSVRKA